MHFYSVAILKRNVSLFTYSSNQALKRGQIVTVAFKNRTVEASIINEVQAPTFRCDEIIAHTSRIYLEQQLQLCTFIASYYVCELSQALSLCVPNFENDTRHTAATFDEAAITLSSAQQEALTFLQENRASLLFADTGAGKTEIYMKRMASIVQAGKQALLLMPEISLTPQTFKRLQRFFTNDSVAIWHSKLTPKQRQNNFEKIVNGSAKVIAGARSALFLPLQHLGIIVVDEEHDESYKSSKAPRYNARDVAQYYAKQLAIPIVLGSATPSVNSYANMPFFRLRGGYYKSHKTFLFESSQENISPQVQRFIQESADASMQSILFLPTRASFKYVQCQACGYTLECPFCSVGMSLHKNTKSMRCHYCNYVESIPSRCSKCGHTQMQSIRLGTAEASEQLQQLFPKLHIAQFDRDTITTASKLQKALQAFNDGKTDVLVGTQMLAKGHDYHKVRLVVIMGLDNIKEQSDYRAFEKAVSLMVQIAGRSGRKEDATVFIQSKEEQFFRRYIDDYELFLRDELLCRKALYPPFKRLARLIFTHQQPQKAQERMQKALHLLQGHAALEVVGAAAAPIARIANKYRYTILLRAVSAKVLIQAAMAVKSLGCDIDIDPLEFN